MVLMTWITMMIWLPKARRPEVWNQVGLRKHYYNKASGGDGILAELFLILKEDAVKVLHSVYKQMCKTQQRPQDCKSSVFIPVPKKDNAKECSDYQQLHSFHMLVRLSSKSFKLGFSSTWNRNFQMYKLGKERGTGDQIANICWIIEKGRESWIYFCFIDYVKAFDCVNHSKLWKMVKEMGIQDHLTCLLRNPYEGQETTELHMEQHTGSKLGKE